MIAKVVRKLLFATYCMPDNQGRTQEDYKRDLSPHQKKLPKLDLTNADYVANLVNVSTWL